MNTKQANLYYILLKVPTQHDTGDLKIIKEVCLVQGLGLRHENYGAALCSALSLASARGEKRKGRGRRWFRAKALAVQSWQHEHA